MPELDKKSQKQLNSEPVVILHRIPNQKSVSTPSFTSSLPKNSSEEESQRGDAMQRYQIVKKTLDPRDPTATGSLNLKINLTGVPGVKPGGIKRKASLAEALAVADSAYTEKPNKKLRSSDLAIVDSISSRDDSSQNGDSSSGSSRKNKGLTSHPSSEELKQSTSKNLDKNKTPKFGENDKPKRRTDGRLKSSEDTGTSTGYTGSSSPTGSHHSGSTALSPSKKDKRLKEKKKKKSKEKGEKFAFVEGKSNVKYSATRNRNKSDGAEGSASDDESTSKSPGDPQVEGQGLVVSLSVRPPLPSTDEAVTDEEALDNERKEAIDSALALIALENGEGVGNFEEEPPRSDSAATLPLELDQNQLNVSREDALSVDLVSPVKNNTPSVFDDDDPPDLSQPNVEPGSSDSNDPSGDSVIQSDVGDKSSTTKEEIKNDALPKDSPNQEVPEGGTKKKDEVTGEENQTRTSNTATPEPSDRETTDSETPVAMDTAETLLKLGDQETDPPGIEGTVETTSKLTSNTELVEKPKEQAKLDKAIVIFVKKDVADRNDCICRCWPTTTPLNLLDRRESEIIKEQASVQESLTNTKHDRKSMEKELEMLVAKSQTQREDAVSRKANFESENAEAAVLQATVERCRSARNQFLLRKKKSHQAVLETEIQLRQLQMELCKHQLEADARTPDGTKTDDAAVEAASQTATLTALILEKERQVAELKEQVETKTHSHQETEEAYSKAEAEYQSANEAYQLLARRLEQTRSGLNSIDQGVDEMIGKINEITDKLGKLSNERKNNLLKSLKLEEELIQIEACRKLQLVEEKRAKILASSDDDDCVTPIPKTPENSAIPSPPSEPLQPPPLPSPPPPPPPPPPPSNVPNPQTTLTPRIVAAEASVITEIQTPRPPPPCSPRPERPTSVIVHSPPIRMTSTVNTPMPSDPIPSDSPQRASADPPSPVRGEMEVDEEQDQEPDAGFLFIAAPAVDKSPPPGVSRSPSPESIFLRAPSPTTLANAMALASVVTANVAVSSPTTSSPAPSPSSGFRLVDSLTSCAVSSAGSSFITPIPSAQSPEQITLNALEAAVPFYAQFLSTPGGGPSRGVAELISTMTDEKLMYQEIVNGCRKFVTWATDYLKTTYNCTRDTATLHKSAGYMKDYLIPFYRLMLNRGVTASALLDSIVTQAAKSGFYGMPSMDVAYLRTLLENNLRLAVDIGIRYKDKAMVTHSSSASASGGTGVSAVVHLPPSRVEFSPSSGASSLPTFTIHPPTAPGTEPYPNSHGQSYQQHPPSLPHHHSPALPSSSSSPIGALNSMINSQQGFRSGAGGGNTNGVLMTDLNHPPGVVSGVGMRPGWNGGPGPGNGGMPYQQGGGGQNTAVVVPLQYGQHRGGDHPPHQRIQPNNNPNCSGMPMPPGHHPWPPQQSLPGNHPVYHHHPQHHPMMPPNQHHPNARMPQYHPHHPIALHPQQQHYRSQPPPPSLPPPPPPPPPSQQQYYQSMDQHAQQLLGPGNGGASMTPPEGRRHLRSSSSSSSEGLHPPGHPHAPQPRMRHHSSSAQVSQHSPASAAHVLSNMSAQQQQQLQQQQMQQQRLQHYNSGSQQSATSVRRISQEQAQSQAQPAQQQQPTNVPVYTCLKCGKEAHQKCSGCQTTFYCSRSCQVAHWDEHGKTCSKP